MSVPQLMVGQNFGNRLVTEFQRSGKKSIVLALLLVVGLCIWGPMLWRKVFPKQETETTATQANKAAPSIGTASQRNPATPPPSATSIEWKSLYRRIEESSLVQPVALDELVRDPFDREWVREKKPVAIEPPVETQPEHDPIRTLVVSAILASADGGAAVINDVVYRVGQKVPNEGPVRYILKDIRSDRVVLERGGKLHDLSLKDAATEAKESSDEDK